MSLQTDNDELGHGRGDEVLAAVGVALQSTTARDSDFVGRYGGEEFIILLPNTDREGAAVITERVRQTIAGIDVLGERRITASFGIAVFPEDAPDPTRLIRNADRALYRAKPTPQPRRGLLDGGLPRSAPACERRRDACGLARGCRSPARNV